MSLFNEPGGYTKIPYNEIADLLENHVGPSLEKSGLKTKIMLSEAPTRDNAHKNYPILLDDPDARKYVSAMPYHGYDFKEFELITDLHQRYPKLPLWMTEICWAYEADAPKDVPLPRYDWEDGDFWGKQIFGDIDAGASAWIYWNMILDEKGGPWLVSPIHGNPDPNVQHPVVIINRQTKKVTYTALYYYLTHFSKFVRPGDVRVEARGNVNGVRCLAFRTPKGGHVAELMNSLKEDTTLGLELNGHSVELTLVYPKNFISFLAQAVNQVVKPAWRLLSLIMKTIQSLWRQPLELLRLGQEVILYALIFISAFFRNRASLGCELVAIRSQLTFYKESILQ